MTRIVAIHSFRGGTGKSNATANIAAQLAAAGKRVGIVDADIQSPGIHVLFGLDGNRITSSLNDFFRGAACMADIACDVTARLNRRMSGKVFLIPSSARSEAIINVLREGYNVSLLTSGFRRLIDRLKLDCLLIDTHPGLNEETLFSIAISHRLIVVMRPDHQDYEGTGVTIEVARSLDVPRMSLIVNKTPAFLDADDVRSMVQETYDIGDVTILPYCAEMLQLASGGIFSTAYPDHPLTTLYQQLARSIIARDER